MTESEAIEKLKNMRLYMQIEDKNNDCKFTEDDYKANEMAIQALEKQIPKKPTTIDYEKYMDTVKNALFLKGSYWCPNCNHVVKCGTCGCDSPFSYLQIADVQESLREIENTLNIKVKE